MENKQTAVEWLIDQLRQLAYSSNTHLGMGDVRVTQGMLDDLEEQAKQMEKQESIAELRYKDGTPMRKYNSPKLQELEQINQDNPMTKGSTALVKVTSSQKEISDEEIEKFASDFYDSNGSESIFIMGAKWYREQLKKK